MREIPHWRRRYPFSIIAAEREKYSNLIREIYVSHGYYPISLSGNYTERYEKAVKLVEDMLR